MSLIELLETRRLLASIVNNTLIVDGTSGVDRIYLDYSSDRKKFLVTIAGATQQLSTAGVTAIKIDAKAGNDKITLKTHTGTLRVSLMGGAGNDSIRGHASAETLLGGDGKDTLSGGGGNDYIKGEANNDLILGSVGNDRLYGDSGDDIVYGDEGADKLYGGYGRDTMGGDDEDRLLFTSPTELNDSFGNDILDGGPDDDWLLGGFGNAYLPDSNGKDTFTGGSGADIIDLRGGNDAVTDLAAEDTVPSVEHLPYSEGQPGDSHGHALIRIWVYRDGSYAQVVIPANIGVYSSTSLAGVHTHEFDGIIHYESSSSAGYSLKDFFQLWGTSFDASHVGRYVATPSVPILMKVTPSGGVAQDNFEFESYRPNDEDTIDIFIG